MTAVASRSLWSTADPDDPLAKALQPPIDETPEERAVRLRQLEDAARVSKEIDDDKRDSLSTESPVDALPSVPAPAPRVPCSTCPGTRTCTRARLDLAARLRVLDVDPRLPADEGDSEPVDVQGLVARLEQDRRNSIDRPLRLGVVPADVLLHAADLELVSLGVQPPSKPTGQDKG